MISRQIPRWVKDKIIHKIKTDLHIQKKKNKKKKSVLFVASLCNIKGDTTSPHACLIRAFLYLHCNSGKSPSYPNHTKQNFNTFLTPSYSVLARYVSLSTLGKAPFTQIIKNKTSILFSHHKSSSVLRFDLLRIAINSGKTPLTQKITFFSNPTKNIPLKWWKISVICKFSVH